MKKVVEFVIYMVMIALLLGAIWTLMWVRWQGKADSYSALTGKEITWREAIWLP